MSKASDRTIMDAITELASHGNSLLSAARAIMDRFGLSLRDSVDVVADHPEYVVNARHCAELMDQFEDAAKVMSLAEEGSTCDVDGVRWSYPGRVGGIEEDDAAQGTPEHLAEIIRIRLLEKLIGLIDDAALIQWADQRIASLAAPPYDLIRISMGESLVGVRRLDFGMNPVCASDGRTLAAIILVRWWDDELQFDDVAKAIDRLVGLSWEDRMNDWVYQQFERMSMHAHLIQVEDHYDVEEVIESIRTRLMNVALGDESPVDG